MVTCQFDKETETIEIIYKIFKKNALFHLFLFRQALIEIKTAPIIIDKYIRYSIENPFAVRKAQLKSEPTTSDTKTGTKNFIME